MLKWYHSLYVGEKVRKREKKVRARLDSGKTVIGRCIITLAANQSDQLDIVMTQYLSQRIVRQNVPLIVGIAADRKEAVRLVVKMTEDAIRKTGEPDIRKMIQENL